MRRMWAAGAAIVMCLTFGGLPVLGQDETEEASPVAAAATPAPPPTPASSATPGRTLVSGSMSCQLHGVPGPGESPYPTRQEIRSGVAREWFDLTCTYTMSDPRVSGTERYSYLGMVVDVPDLPGGAIFWDSVPLVLTTAGGTWKGVGMGVDYLHEPTLYTVGYTVYEGQGAYSGLTYMLMWSRGTRNYGDPYLVSGSIEPME
jgi:hypothetical protein